MEEFRRLFHRWTKDRLDLGRHLVHASSGTGETVLIRIFPEMSFVIDDASGARPAAIAVRRAQVTSGPALAPGGSLVRPARPLGPGRREPRWEFPRGFRSADLQVDLENWLSSCAAAVEERFLDAISSSGGIRQAAAAVTLRAAALRVLGRLGGDEGARVVDAAAAVPDQITGSWSSAWQELARPPPMSSPRSVRAHRRVRRGPAGRYRRSHRRRRRRA